MLRTKIDNVKVMAEASDSAKVVTTVGKADDLIYLGQENAGYVQVESGKGGGWVKKVLVNRN